MRCVMIAFRPAWGRKSVAGIDPMSDFYSEAAGFLPKLGPAGDLLAITAAPIAVVVTAFVISNLNEAKITTLQGAIDRVKDDRDFQIAKAQAASATTAAQLQAEVERLRANHEALEGKYQRVTQAGAVIQTQLKTIEDMADDIADRIGVDQCSILVPAPTKIAGDTPEHLIFLYASGPAAATLEHVHVPIATSGAGAVYRSGEAAITRSAGATTPAFSKQTDTVTGFTTHEMLSVCLRYRTRTVGVAQFINKRGGAFTSDDRERAGNECLQLAGRVAEFVADPTKLIALGHAPREERVEATIMAIDLSRFSGMFETLDSNVITDLLNQYFQDLCRIAMDHGGEVDQFMGDGALLTFNVIDRQADHAVAALNAARQMREAFRRLRGKWRMLGHAAAGELFMRIGLSCGKVARAEIGYRASRMTVIGTAVNMASKACAAAPRDRDTIVVTPTFKAAVMGSIDLAPLPPEPFGDLFEVV